MTQAEQMALVATLIRPDGEVDSISLLEEEAGRLRQLQELVGGYIKASGVRVEATVGDVFDVSNAAEDLVYLAPPYTKRQYASYYHILETVAMGDEPEVGGVAGLRPWRALASDFCYKTRAFKTLSRLVSGLKAQKVLLSYSSEGHICMEDMKAELSKIGEFTMHPLGAIGRYRPNKVASSTASDVNEFLVVVERPMAQLSKTQPKIIKATNPILVESHA